MKDILLIEDNKELAELMKAFLNKEGFSLYHATSGEEAILWLKEHTTKLLLLDIMLPEMDGFAVCKEVRKQQNIPIIIISARSNKSDQLMGFELGADDYLEKPVDIDILCAKIRVLMQRFYTKQIQSDLLYSGAICIHEEAHRVFLHDKELELNVKEYELLMLLVKNTGKSLQKEYIFNQIWGFDSFSENQTLTVHIKMLRSKIEDDPRNPKRIQTIWGIGYRYEEV